MKIATVGNLAQLGYIITKELRNYGLDADLYVTCKNNVIARGQNPKEYDDLKEFPKWVKLYNTRPILPAFITGKKIFSKYDAIIALTLSPSYVQFFNKNFIAIATGSDSREFIFQRGIYNFLLRRAYKKAKHFFCNVPEFEWVPKKLKIENKASFLPTPIDVNKILTIHEKIEKENNKENDDILTIFIPSSWSLSTSTFKGNKGTDIILSGLEKIIQEGYKIKIKMINQENNPNTSPLDIAFVQQMRKKYPSNFILIDWISNKQELIREYIKSDIIADQFFLGIFGMIGLESMACKKPLINSYFKKNDKVYGNERPPIIIANDKEQVYQQIKKILDHPDRKQFLKNIGIFEYLWVKKHHDIKSVVKKIINVL